jgi:hypothetical protein
VLDLISTGQEGSLHISVSVSQVASGANVNVDADHVLGLCNEPGHGFPLVCMPGGLL